MARTVVKDFSENVCVTDVGFSGVGSKGTAKETGTIRMKVGEKWVDIWGAFCGNDSQGQVST
jgi:hypothetical protein